jgi:putative flippase GtrA
MRQQAIQFVRAALRGDIRLVRYLAVGVLNTLFGYGIFALMLRLGLHYAAASGVATVLGVLFNFKSTGQLVFNSHDNGLIVRFVLVYVVVYLANVLALATLLRLGIGAYVGGVMLIMPLALLAYFLNVRYVFRTHEKTP